MSMLKTQGLVKIYGSRRVVDGVSFEVDQGEIVGLLGPNGAGKTTSFRIACGMIEPNAGQVFLDDKEVTDWPMYRRSRDGGMGYLAQESSVFRKLTVEQNLLGVMEMLGFERDFRQHRCDELLDQFDIARLRKSRAQSLSGGERRRLEIARCLVSDPKLILLDEPFTGIDPVTIASIQEIVRELRKTGIGILITDHQVRETLQITDRSYVMRAGRVLCHGTPEEVTSNPEAREYYFGDIDFGLRGPHAGEGRRRVSAARPARPARRRSERDESDERSRPARGVAGTARKVLPFLAKLRRRRQVAQRNDHDDWDE
ncbi:MAG: LPS export ABC transporter ATP-binding protein [Pirellulales bacterium]|nr:LPS export ABC transporter ATP-binding protein [Pirellulales bacterium]